MAVIQKGSTHDNLFPPKKCWCMPYSCSNKENKTSFPLTLNSKSETNYLLITNGREGGITVSVIVFWQILIW